MRRIHIALPVIGLLLSGGVAFAATGTSATSPGTSPGTQATTTTHTRMGTSTTAGGGKFASENEATKACGGSGNVVWGNAGTKVYHIQGDKYFGHTKRGAFMCKSTATAEGFHAPGEKTAHKG